MPLKIVLLRLKYEFAYKEELSYIYDIRWIFIMAKAKIYEFTDQEVSISEYAKAISHPARVRILQILNDLNICMTGDIVNLLPLSQSTVSQHLIELKKVGLIKGEIEGPKTCYCINKENFKAAKKIISTFFAETCNC